MIKRIKNSLTVKICLLTAMLLLAASGITYGAVAGFLPVYYSSQLETDLDAISKEMAETISGHKTLEDAENVIELFEAGSQVDVMILDEQGAVVWPQIPEETAGESGNFVEETDEETWETVEDTVTESVETAEETTEDTAEESTEEFVEESWDSSETGIIEQGTSEIGYFPNEATAEAVDTQDAYEAYDSGNSSESSEASSSSSAVKHYDLEVGGKAYTMLVSGGMQPVNQAMGILKQIFPYILGISAVIAVLFALGASLYLTAPVVKLSQLSRRIAALDFSGVYKGRRTDEIGILGRNLNEMSANLSKTLEELRQANEKLKSDIELERETERKRIVFFSAVSHELKTPITILKGHLSGMLQKVGAYQDRDYYLKRSEETVQKMEDMVQELLTVSRIESRAVTMEQSDIAEQLRLQLAELMELMEEKNLELMADLPEHLNAEVNAPMMEKVFRNLLMNAIRYTPGGAGNRICVFLGSDAPGGSITCTVENTGVYIPEEAIPHLFEAFYRVEQSRSRQTGGSGLGLYIVKMVLEQHGARYRIENTKDGVKFSFSLRQN